MQQLDRQRRENTQVMIPSARTGLEVCSTSGGDIWCMGKNSRPVFCTTSSTTCSTRKFYHAEFHLWQIESLVSSSQRPCFPKELASHRVEGIWRNERSLKL